MQGPSAPKRLRAGAEAEAEAEVELALDWPRFFSVVPKDLSTPSGDTLNAAVLRLVGSQALAACCRGALEWCTAGGRRLVLSLDEECRGPGGPYAPLERIDASHVESVRLGRYGRRTPEEAARVLAACARARVLRCVYSKLPGMGGHLAALAPRLSLQRAKLHQCRLEAADVVQLLRSAPRLEALDVYGESLAGLGEQVNAAALRCPAMRSIEFTDCGLLAEDAGALLRCFGDSLTSVHIQASDLQGLRIPVTPTLKALALLDCRLSLEDAAAVAARCPQLEALALCGNPLGCSACGPTWPLLPRLRSADFRDCQLDSEDEAELRGRLQGCPHLEFRTRPVEPSAALSCRHIVFEDSSDAE